MKRKSLYWMMIITEGSGSQSQSALIYSIFMRADVGRGCQAIMILDNAVWKDSVRFTYYKQTSRRNEILRGVYPEQHLHPIC